MSCSPINSPKPSKISENHEVLSQSPENKAATVIQKHFRGYRARKAHLPNGLYKNYAVQYQKIDTLTPKAKQGNTRVYLPKEMPQIVFKQSGRENGIKRFHQMQFVRSILASQKSTHLIIPKANLFNDYLVEERLPINTDSFYNMEIYLSKPHLFDQAVREMTGLFSKIYLSDLLGYRAPIGNIPNGEGSVRYDNIPLYLVEKNGKKEGKIGLIDLEHLESTPRRGSGLQTLVKIFPLHLDLIKKEATQLNIEFKEELLNQAANNGKTFLKVAFEDHIKWLKEKGVSTDTVFEPFELSLERTEHLKTLVKNELMRLNQGINPIFSKKGIAGLPQKDFFIGDSETLSQELAEKITPLILNNIKKTLQDNRKNFQNEEMKDLNLVNARSIVCHRASFYEEVKPFFSENEQIVFKEFSFFEIQDISEQLTLVIAEELVKGGELFAFDPAFYTQGHNLCWIRY
jgi:hypothetical protein